MLHSERPSTPTAGIIFVITSHRARSTMCKWSIGVHSEVTLFARVGCTARDGRHEQHHRPFPVSPPSFRPCHASIHLSILVFAVLLAHPDMAKFKCRTSLEDEKARERENVICSPSPPRIEARSIGMTSMSSPSRMKFVKTVHFFRSMA